MQYVGKIGPSNRRRFAMDQRTEQGWLPHPAVPVIKGPRLVDLNQQTAPTVPVQWALVRNTNNPVNAAYKAATWMRATG